MGLSPSRRIPTVKTPPLSGSGYSGYPPGTVPSMLKCGTAPHCGCLLIVVQSAPVQPRHGHYGGKARRRQRQDPGKRRAVHAREQALDAGPRLAGHLHGTRAAAAAVHDAATARPSGALRYVGVRLWLRSATHEPCRRQNLENIKKRKTQGEC